VNLITSNHTSPVNSQESGNVKGFGILIILSALMPYIPDADIGTGIFAVWFTIFIIYSIVKYGLFLKDTNTIFAILFLIFGLFSYFNLNSNGYGFDQWYRAFFPFTFFILFLFIGKLDKDQAIFLSKSIFIASLVWLSRILIEAMISASQGSGVLTNRLTFYVIDSVLIFPFVALTMLLLTNDYPKGKSKWFFIAIFIYMVVWIGYRAGIVIATIPILFYIFQNSLNKRYLSLALLLTLISVFYASGIASSLGLLDRFSNLSGESGGSKASEWRYAMDIFLQSPLFGKGLGWQVPGYLAYIGVDTTGIVLPSTVGYVHSAFAYMAMNMGLLGLVSYYGMISPRIIKINDDAYKKFSTIAMIVIILFCLTQVAFRTIQTIIIIVALIKINNAYYSNNKL
jgi:hypothetical protein